MDLKGPRALSDHVARKDPKDSQVLPVHQGLETSVPVITKWKVLAVSDVVQMQSTTSLSKS